MSGDRQYGTILRRRRGLPSDLLVARGADVGAHYMKLTVLARVLRLEPSGGKGFVSGLFPWMGLVMILS